jgi:hypothetical protein
MSNQYNWMVMETFDVDGDEDIDIVLGAFSFENTFSRQKNLKNLPGLLILKNNKTTSSEFSAMN